MVDVLEVQSYLQTHLVFGSLTGPFIRLQFQKINKNSALNKKQEITLKRKHQQTYQQKHLPPLYMLFASKLIPSWSPASFPGHLSATFPLALDRDGTPSPRTSLTNGSFNCITSNVPGASSDPPPKAFPKVVVKLGLRAYMSYEKKQHPIWASLWFSGYCGSWTPHLAGECISQNHRVVGGSSRFSN